MYRNKYIITQLSLFVNNHLQVNVFIYTMTQHPCLVNAQDHTVLEAFAAASAAFFSSCFLVTYSRTISICFLTLSLNL